MYSGIVYKALPIVEISDKEGLRTLVLPFDEKLLEGLALGASVSVDGVCLTVSKIDGDRVSFDVMIETLKKTTLGTYQVGDEVNVERSMKDGDEIGGHPISGHIDGTVKVIDVQTPENNHIITMQIEKLWMKYIFEKGYISLNGASLTLADVDKTERTFRVYLIPETLRLTSFGQKKVGDSINFEVERQTQVMVDTVENFLEEKLAPVLSAKDGKLNESFLAQILSLAE